MLFKNDGKQPGSLTSVTLVFCLFWLTLFALYFPAANAGFVSDFTGWLDQVRNHRFTEFINRTHFEARSMYQLTQLNTYILYKLLGTSPWAWHLLFISFHALNACLLFVLSAGILADTGVTNNRTIAFSGALLFCLSPYISEVVVWEPSFHFLQGLLLILLILLCVQKYIATDNFRYVLTAIVFYTLSLFSLEIFYITPWLVLSLGFVYLHTTSDGKSKFRKVAKFLFVPMLLLFLLRFIAYRLYSGDWISRIGSGTVTMVTLESFGKPAKYIFHLLLLGRFFPQDARNALYDFCDSLTGIILFYSVAIITIIYILRNFSKMNGKAKTTSLFLCWCLAALLLLVPLWFPSDMLVLYDRYTYFAGAFFYIAFAVLASFITISYLQYGLLGLFALINIRFAIQVSRYWNKSYKIVNSLLHTIPDARNKTMILLNIPQCMHGVPMIGAEKNSEFKLMHDLLIPDKLLTNTVYDGLAYNMLTPADGAHVIVVNDSLIKVTLNQWGTWWWYETRGAYGYWTTDYKLNLNDPGHWYELTLRKPADQYMILYSVGDKWKEVDMSKKNVDQN